MSMLSAPYNRLYERVKQLEYANGLLRKSEQRKMERIEQLEALVVDVWRAYSVKAEESFHPVWEVDSDLAERMAALGLLEGDDE